MQNDLWLADAVRVNEIFARDWRKHKQYEWAFDYLRAMQVITLAFPELFEFHTTVAGINSLTLVPSQTIFDLLTTLPTNLQFNETYPGAGLEGVTNPNALLTLEFQEVMKNHSLSDFKIIRPSIDFKE
jgi:hypothetical protein